MSDKLERARHIRPEHRPPAAGGAFHGARARKPSAGHFPKEGQDRALPDTNNPRWLKEAAEVVRGRHGGVDKTVLNPPPDPGATGLIPVMGSHVGVDRTATASLPTVGPAALQDRSLAQEGDIAVAEDSAESRVEAAGASAALISVCVIISRITGFARTWAMAFALGSTFVSSSYQVANNLPDMLYEMVIGGMLVTAFLPVYLSVKKKLGPGAGNAYASNLLTIVVLMLSVVSALCMLFPAQIIFTQSFYSDQEQMALAVFFFRFFAVQILFYGASAIVSGLLNANREYFWSSFAPVFNNIIVIIAFVAYATLARYDQNLAYYAIAIGNPLGIFVQLAFQLPALRRVGIRLRPRIDLHDPALRDTVRLGAPAIFVTLCSFATVSVQNAAAYCLADNGPSVIAYARLWFTFPYSFIAVSVTTSLFTELADMHAEGDKAGVIRGVVEGTRQILFLMIPFAMYLVVFATPLVTLYHIGAFTEDAIGQIAGYLAVMALALPFYSLNSFMNKTFSSIRRMGVFSLIYSLAVVAQIAVAAGAAWAYQNGFPVTLEAIAASTIVSYVLANTVSFIYLRWFFGPMGLGRVVLSLGRGLVLGAAGAVAGAGVLWLLGAFVAPLSGGIAQAFGYIVAGGLVSLAVTFALPIARQWPEAVFITSAVRKIKRKLGR